MNRVSQLEKFLSNKKCPRCKAVRLIQRKPRNYAQVRCCNCGAIGRINAGIPTT